MRCCQLSTSLNLFFEILCGVFFHSPLTSTIDFEPYITWFRIGPEVFKSSIDGHGKARRSKLPSCHTTEKKSHTTRAPSGMQEWSEPQVCADGTQILIKTILPGNGRYAPLPNCFCSIKDKVNVYNKMVEDQDKHEKRSGKKSNNIHVHESLELSRAWWDKIQYLAVLWVVTGQQFYSKRTDHRIGPPDTVREIENV